MSEQGGHGQARSKAVAHWAKRGLDLYGWCDAKPYFGPSLALAVALCVGMLLAFDLFTPDHPHDLTLEGTPASQNVKAPYDLEIIDAESTTHLREEAVARVRRVYDYDAQAGQHTAEVIERAFGVMREALVSPQARRGDERLQAATGLEFEKLLNVSIAPEEFAILRAGRFSTEMEEAVKVLVRAAERDYIVGHFRDLKEDRDRGIVVQRVPAENTTAQSIDSLTGLLDVATVRRDMPGRASAMFPTMPREVLAPIAALAGRLVQPNLSLNRAETELRRADARLGVKPVSISVKKGEMVIRDGERITRRHLLVFNGLKETGRGSSLALMGAGGATLLLVLLATATRVARTSGRRRFKLQARDLAFLATLFVVGLGGARLWLSLAQSIHETHPNVQVHAFMFLLPMAAGPMVVRLVLRMEVALLFAVVASLMLGLLVETGGMIGIYALVGGCTGATAVPGMTARRDLIRAGSYVGLAQAAGALAIYLFAADTQWQHYLLAVPTAFVGGLLAGFVALSLTALLEWGFGYTTDLQLLELSNLNHPALKELIVQAPGSYHHSIIVGSLVEAAAESIGANPLLGRVMAYYHDLGKGCNPGYFIENQRSGHNPHDKLKPSMSAMIIRRHVTDGLEIARRYELGAPVLAGIAQHHGTTLIHYFFHKAKELAEEGETVSEAEYRYPGQKPQSREAALVMLGDSIEAASRSLADPTPARLQGLVNRIISHKFTDGQLEECDLTLRDLHTIAKSFSMVLNSIYHHRPEYPDMLRDIAGKKHSADSDSKPPKRAEAHHEAVEDNPPDNLRRLGL